MAAASLTEMKARNLPHATAADVTKQVERFEVKLPTEKLDDYLSRFVKPDGGHLCPRDSGHFTWGLVHGCGHCTNCGWPGQLYHFPKDADGKEHRFEALLWFHPDELEEHKKSA